jgi:hypothetical protein
VETVAGTASASGVSDRLVSDWPHLIRTGGLIFVGAVVAALTIRRIRQLTDEA